MRWEQCYPGQVICANLMPRFILCHCVSLTGCDYLCVFRWRRGQQRRWPWWANWEESSWGWWWWRGEARLTWNMLSILERAVTKDAHLQLEATADPSHYTKAFTLQLSRVSARKRLVITHTALNLSNLELGLAMLKKPALPDYSWRTSPQESIVVIVNCIQLPHVSFACLKTLNIITMNIGGWAQGQSARR